MSEAVAILPGNSTPLERALATTDDRILAIDADVVRRVTRPDECPSDQLHILAWEYSVDEWDPAWDDDRKRAVIKASFEVHRHKGTAYALDQAIRALGKNARIEEWYEYGGHPYRFRITVDLQPDQVFTKADMRRLIRLALRTKNVRSYLDYVGLARSVSGTLSVGAFIRSRVTVTIDPTVTTGLTIRPYMRIGAHSTVRSITTIYPGA